MGSILDRNSIYSIFRRLIIFEIEFKDESLGAHLWMDLSSRLNDLLKMELDEVMVELSACELLQGEPDLVNALM